MAILEATPATFSPVAGVAARSGEVKHVQHPWLVGNVEPSLTLDLAAERLGKVA